MGAACANQTTTWPRSTSVISIQAIIKIIRLFDYFISYNGYSDMPKILVSNRSLDYLSGQNRVSVVVVGCAIPYRGPRAHIR